MSKSAVSERHGVCLGGYHRGCLFIQEQRLQSQSRLQMDICKKIWFYHHRQSRCWIELLEGWAELSKDTSDGTALHARNSGNSHWPEWWRLLNQQEGDKYTGEPCICHRFFAPCCNYLDTTECELKTMREVRWRVKIAERGGGVMKASRGK